MTARGLRDPIPLILASTVAFVMAGAVVALAVDQVFTDDDATIVIGDVFEVTKLLVTGLFAYIGGVSHERARDRPSSSASNDRSARAPTTFQLNPAVYDVETEPDDDADPDPDDESDDDR